MHNPLLHTDPFADEPTSSPLGSKKKPQSMSAKKLSRKGSTLRSANTPLSPSAKGVGVTAPSTAPLASSSPSATAAADAGPPGASLLFGAGALESRQPSGGPVNPLGGADTSPRGSVNLNAMGFLNSQDDADAALGGAGGTHHSNGGGGESELDLLFHSTTHTMKREPDNPSKPTTGGGASPGKLTRRASSSVGSRRTKDFYTKEGDLCWDAVTKYHCCCFPCAVDGIYGAMHDPGFTPCSLRAQMVVCGVVPALWPFYYACCCMQSYALRAKFNTVIAVRESTLDHLCSAVCCPCVLTAQVHREIELRGQAVWTTSTPCAEPRREYSGDKYAPAMQDMMADGRRLPYLPTQQPFGGGALTADESLSNAAEAQQHLAPILPLVAGATCCGKQVVYNSWRHCLLIGFGLSTDACCGAVEGLCMCCGGSGGGTGR